jgi:hypothetical protein
MDYFYIIVLSVAIVILILLLTFFGLSLTKNSTSGNGAWPPVEGTCPDYWQVDPKDAKYCIIPNQDPLNPNVVTRNTGSIYSANGSLDPNFKNTPGYDSNGLRVNFNDGYFTTCNKLSWSKKWGIFWDGYTNYNGKC